MINQQQVKKLFTYKKGKLYWKIPPSSKRKKGDRAGSIHKSTGYRRITINYKQYLEHRLVWLYYYGCLPKQLDHINRDKLDNRIVNLRETTTKQNHMNMNKRKGNYSSCYKGVSYFKETNKWRADIFPNNKHISLGYYSTEAKAAEAYNKAAKKYYGKYACLNTILGE